jgi:TusA-related sulfurtransferase
MDQSVKKGDLIMGFNRILAACTVAAATALSAGAAMAQATVVTCESIDYRSRECPVPGGPVTLTRQLSSSPGDCIPGRTWGFNAYNNTIWVANGCRAEFSVGAVHSRPHERAPGVTLTCESVDYRNQECPVPGGPVFLRRQLSSPPGDCIEGRTWGFNGYSNTIWVTNGCRAEFRAGVGD